MKTSRAWTVYIVVRVLAFIIPFALIMFVLPGWQWNWLIAAVVGAIVSLTISQIFLHNERFAIAGSLEERAKTKAEANAKPRPIDLEEDADIDAQLAADEADASADGEEDPEEKPTDPKRD